MLIIGTYSRIYAIRYKHPNYPLTKFREGASYVQYGISELANTQDKGVKILRMNNLQNEGWDFTDIKHIELSSEELERYLIAKGDVLFNRTNSKELVGKCEVFREKGEWVFASYLIRVRFDELKMLPDFITAFLNTTAGRLQINMISRQIIGMTNINAVELQDLVVPLPAIEIQKKILGQYFAARDICKSKLVQADMFLGIG